MRIHLEDIHKAFGTKKVLQGLDLRVEPGETYCIIGRSGAGKSVTLKHITGLLGPDRGRVNIDGRDVTRVREREYVRLRSRMGVLFQDGALINWLDVGENVALPLREHERLREGEIRRRVSEKLALVELTGAESLMPDSISGGMRKRVGLARAMIRDPELILYDEPTSGLDPVMSNQINDLIVATQTRTGVTSIVVTHDMNAAYQIADRIGMFYEGTIIEEGTAEEIRATRNPITRQFIEGRTRGPITSEESTYETSGSGSTAEDLPAEETEA